MTWTYHRQIIDVADAQKELNAMGADGWELVQLERIGSPHPQYMATMKKPLIQGNVHRAT